MKTLNSSQWKEDSISLHNLVEKVHHLVNKILHLQIGTYSRFIRLRLDYLFYMLRNEHDSFLIFFLIIKYLSYRIKLILSTKNKLGTYSSHLYLFRDIIMFSTDGQTLLNHHVLIRGSRIYILYRVVSGE